MVDAVCGVWCGAQDIKFGCKIGEGAFGDVFRGTLWGLEVAIKTMKGLKRSAIKDFKAEVQIMRRLRHPNIVAYLGASFEKPNLCIVAEYLHNGSLEDLIDKKQKVRYCRLCRALL
jgi:serine/threonine protein kinase